MKIEVLKRILSSIILIPLSIFIIIKGSILFLLFLLLCFFVCIYEWYKMVNNVSILLIGSLYLILSFISVYMIREYLNLSYYLLLLILSVCVATDIGGYVFGNLFKGPKLTKISPKKTYSGVIGGYLFSIIFTVLFFNYADYILEITYIKVTAKELSLNNFILTIFISTISQLGDIAVSYFKRKSNIKDTGKIIPGHGGLLDRIDGMIFAFPATFLVFKVI